MSGTARALVLPVQGQAYLTRLNVTLSTLQQLVGGDIEPLYLSDSAVMYLNEDGKIAGLPMNPNANRLVYMANPGLADSDYIVGDVVVLGTRNAFGLLDGDEHDVPNLVLEWCRAAGVHVESQPS